MNARQKAKRYKQLYESLKMAPAPIVYEHLPLIHCITETRIPNCDGPWPLDESHIANRLIKNMQMIVEENMEKVEDPYTPYESRYCFEFWIKGRVNGKDNVKDQEYN